MKLFSIFLVVLLMPSVALAHGTYSIHITDEGFEPRVLEVEVGTEVEFENVGQNSHWPASNIHPTHEIYPEFDPKDSLHSGQNWSFTFDKPGVWRLHDHVYPELKGTIRVVGEEKRSLLETILGFFANIFSTSPSGMAPLEESADSRYNDSINEDSEEIFHNDDALYSYVKKFGPAKTLQRLHELDSKFGDCHQTAHRAGRFAYELLDEKAFQECVSLCHSGCYHGAIEQYFKEHGTTNVPQAMDIMCGEEANEFYLHQCFHGMGHGLMAWTDYELFEALEMCDLLGDGQRSCYSGVFMENIVGSLAEDHHTNYLNDDPHYPCNIVDDKYKFECYNFQTSRMKELFNNDFSKIASACLEVPEQWRYGCFESMGRDASGNSNENVEFSIEQCNYAPQGNHRKECLKGAVQDMFWEATGQDNALRLCKLLTDKSEKSSCYITVSYRAKFILDSGQEIENFCQKTEEDFRNLCFLIQKA